MDARLSEPEIIALEWDVVQKQVQAAKDQRKSQVMIRGAIHPTNILRLQSDLSAVVSSSPGPVWGDVVNLVRWGWDPSVSNVLQVIEHDVKGTSSETVKTMGAWL